MFFGDGRMMEAGWVAGELCLLMDKEKGKEKRGGVDYWYAVTSR
jgi:hypothetical protein